MNSLDSLFDKIYENRRELIRYFIVVFICSALRSLLMGFGPVCWCVWAILLYVLLKRVVFKNRLENIYLLFTQIMKYTVCISVMWFLHTVIVGALASRSTNVALALALGGVITEILCMIFMYKIVFRKK